MKLRLFMAAVCGLAVAVPPSAAAAQERSVTSSAGRLNADLAAFGGILVRIDRAQAPVRAALMALRSHHQARVAGESAGGSTAALHRAVAEVLAVIDRADADYAEIEIPTLSTLTIPPDLQPAALVDSMRRTNQDLRRAMAELGPLIEAEERNDRAGAERALGRLMVGMGHVMRAQILITRATMAIVPPHSSAWQRSNIELLTLRVLARVAAAWPSEADAADRTLAPDLEAIAGEMEEAVRAGPAALERELAMSDRQIARASAAGDGNAISLLRRSRAVMVAGAPVYTVIGELAAVLREQAALFGDGRVSPRRLTDLIVAYGGIRERLTQIGQAEIAALAANH
jgi:hypothetical protein